MLKRLKRAIEGSSDNNKEDNNGNVNGATKNWLTSEEMGRKRAEAGGKSGLVGLGKDAMPPSSSFPSRATSKHPVTASKPKSLERKYFITVKKKQQQISENVSISIRLHTVFGPGPWSPPRSFLIPDVKPQTEAFPLLIVITSSTGFAIFLLLIILLVLVIFLTHIRQTEKKCVTTSVNPDYYAEEYKPDEWEIERDQVELLQELGQGSFGMVYEGIPSLSRSFLLPLTQSMYICIR